MGKSTKSCIICFLTILFYFGCAPTIKVTPFETIAPSQIKERIDVYTSVASVTKTYKEIALITVDDEGWDADESEMTRLLIEKARLLGADGVIILGKNVQFEGAVPVGGVIIAVSSKVVKGAAIIYTQPESSEKNLDIKETPSNGTGFFISNDGYLLTNAHVISNAYQIFVYSNNVEYKASIIKTDNMNDIAILKVNGKFSFLPLGNSSKVTLGTSVFTVGYPNIQIQGKSPKLTEGVISSLNGIQDDPRVFQISVALQPGNSGGPLMLRTGEVIGITTSSLNDLVMFGLSGKLPQNVNYAIKIDYARILLSSFGIHIDSPEAQGIDEFQSIVELVKKATVVVVNK